MVTIHYAKKDMMREYLLDFIELSAVKYLPLFNMNITHIFIQSHTGENMALALQGVLEDFGVMHKVSLLSKDNALENHS